MGEIIKTRQKADKVIHKIMFEPDEALTLRGNMKNIRLFPMENCNIESEIIEKGKNGVTKHFKLPVPLRTKKRKKLHSISYQAHELKDKMLFIYGVKFKD